MRALVKYGMESDRVEVRDIPTPTAGDGEVLIAVKAAGVCGSDLHMWHNTQSWTIRLPLVLGHEFSGVIAEVGRDATGLSVGDRVTCETAAYVCGRCAYCMTGAYNLCPERRGFGALIDGVFTEYVAARPQIIHHLPDNVTYEQAALTEPICVAYNALVEKTDIKPGDLVVVQGPGPIGTMALLVAQLCGATPIVMLGTSRDAQRLRTATQLGAHYAVNIQEQDALELVRNLSGGLGADVVVDCTGVSAALEQSLALVKPNGQITKVGWGPQPVGFSLDPLVAKAVTLRGSFSHTYGTWERVIGLVAAGVVNLEPLAGAVYALEDWHRAFSDMDTGINVKSVIAVGQ